MANVQVKRKHEICMGHRVVGHEGKCRHLHGHNYVFNFVVQAKDCNLDDVGRVVDFSVVKSVLCEWLEQHWDHKFMDWSQDTLVQSMVLSDHCEDGDDAMLDDSFVCVNFNPTAENIAKHFVEEVAPRAFRSAGHDNLVLVELTLEETGKCHVTYTK